MGMMKKMLSALTAGIMTVSMAASMASASAADKTAIELVNDMGQGWNLGNTFDCWNTRGWTTDTETAWGNPKTTKDMISAIHASGFDSVRVPVTWYENLADKTTFDIDDAYLARVKEVVDYAYDQGMYVIINMHWDWVTDNSLWLNQGEAALPQFTAMWTEIANYFKDYDEHLVFEDMNEVAWQENPYAGYDDNSYRILNKFNSEFVSIIRKTGGNNSKRLLLLAGANTDLDNTCSPKFVVPDDKMVAVSIHYYRPSPFCVADTSSTWGYSATWGSDADINTLNGDFLKMKSTFMDKGIPVILGEYGVLTNSAGAKEKDSIYKFLKTVASTAKATDGIACYLWDAGNAGDMQYFDRKSLEWFDPKVKAVYADLGSGSGTDLPTFEVKNRVTIPFSQVSTDEGGYKIDLSPYGTQGAKLIGALIKGKITSGESVGYGFGFEAVRNGAGDPVWTGEPAVLGSDGTLSVDFDGKGQDDDGTAFTYEISMQYLQVQQWWTTPESGATADLESITLIFDKDINVISSGEETTEATEPTTEATEPTTEATESTTEATESTTEATEPTTEATEPTTEATEPTTEATEPTTEATEPTTQPSDDVILGDLNGDTLVDIMDVIAMNKYLLGVKKLDPAALAAADADQNGSVDSNDALVILKTALK